MVASASGHSSVIAAMMMRSYRWMGCVFLGMFLASVAVGHAIPQSSSVWNIDGHDVRLQYDIPGIEVGRLVAAEGVVSDVPSFLTTYLRERINVSRGSHVCIEQSTPIVQLDSSTDDAAYIQAFHCDDAGNLTITASAFFDVSPSHAHLSRVIMDGQVLAEMVFTKVQISHVIVPTPRSDRQRWATMVAEYARIGIYHIVSGIDHLAFLLGLLLLAPTFRRICLLTGGFTLGHSATLVLVGTNVVIPRAVIVEGLVAFSILVVAAEAIGMGSRSRSLPVIMCISVLGVAFASTPIGSRSVDLYAGLALVAVAFLELIARYPAHRAITQTAITVSFGLCHGMAFASGLQELRVPGTALWPALAGFNIGIEVGQLLFVAAILSLKSLLGRVMVSVPFERLSMGTAVAVASMAAWWFVGRMVAA